MSRRKLAKGTKPRKRARSWLHGGLAAVSLGAAIGGCGGGPTQASDASDLRRAAAASRAKANPSVPALRAAELAKVPNVTFGPYLGTRDDGGLVVWAATDGNERKFSVVALSARGKPLSQAGSVASAPDVLGVVAVRSLGKGYVLSYTRSAAAGETLEALCLGADGVARGVPNVLAPVGGRALWVESVPAGEGAFVFIAARTGDKPRAEISVVRLDAACRPADKIVLARDALAWQALNVGEGAFLAWVQAAEAGPYGRVSVVTLDRSGRASASLQVASEPTAGLDLDAIAINDRVVLAWTEQHPLEPRVVTAVLDAKGKLESAVQRLTPPSGEQALIRLVAAAKAKGRAYVAWEALAVPEGSLRKISLSALTANGHVEGPRAELDYETDDGGIPELVATASGLSALTLAPACARGVPCDTGVSVPFFVQFDERLSPIAAEPLRLEPLGGRTAELGFGLGCAREGCFAISALARTPAPVFVTELEARSKSWVIPARVADAAGTPRVIEHETLARVESLASLAIESASGDEVLAYATDFDPTTPWRRLTKPAPDGRFEPLRARIGLERLPPFGARSAEPIPASPISLRAHSLGGVAVAPGDPTRGELLVAWAGVDAGSPQVFLTLLNRAKQKLSQRMLTRKKGDLGDIALAWVGDGWVVAWVDERAGDPEVFAIKLDARLNRVSPEQRITQANGAASDLDLAFDGKTLRLAWSDARATDLPGHADIYTARLGTRDAARAGDEQRLAATRAHSFAPAIAAMPGGFGVLWIEGAEDGSAGSLSFATLPENGVNSHLLSLPVDGEPRSAGLQCLEQSCRLVTVAEKKEGTALLGASFSGSVSPVLRPLLPLSGNGAATIGPLLRGDLVFFADSTAEGVRIRRARVAW